VQKFVGTFVQRPACRRQLLCRCFSFFSHHKPRISTEAVSLAQVFLVSTLSFARARQTYQPVEIVHAKKSAR
jgi:hypothetical protein